ncbi:hypothetical protein CF071_20965 [Clostridium sporogenes]
MPALFAVGELIAEYSPFDLAKLVKATVPLEILATTILVGFPRANKMVKAFLQIFTVGNGQS